MENRLEKIRKQQNKTQAEVAEFLGISRQAVSLYEKGKRKPSFELIEKLTEYYNVSIIELLGLEEDEALQIAAASEYTGLSKELIKTTLDTLPKTGDLADDISTAIMIITGLPTSTGNESGVAVLNTLLSEVQNKIDSYFKAPDTSTDATGLEVKHASDDEEFLDNADVPLYRFIETSLTEIPRIAKLLNDNDEQSQRLINEATQRLTKSITDAQQPRSNDIKKDATQTDDAK